MDTASRMICISRHLPNKSHTLYNSLTTGCGSKFHSNGRKALRIVAININTRVCSIKSLVCNLPLSLVFLIFLDKLLFLYLLNILYFRRISRVQRFGAKYIETLKLEMQGRKLLNIAKYCREIHCLSLRIL